jgi:hypothetical protein
MTPPDSIHGISVGSTVFIPGDPALYRVIEIVEGGEDGWVLYLSGGEPGRRLAPAWRARLVPRPIPVAK